MTTGMLQHNCYQLLSIHPVLGMCHISNRGPIIKHSSL